MVAKWQNNANGVSKTIGLIFLFNCQSLSKGLEGSMNAQGESTNKSFVST